MFLSTKLVLLAKLSFDVKFCLLTFTADLLAHNSDFITTLQRTLNSIAHPLVATAAARLLTLPQ